MPARVLDFSGASVQVFDDGRALARAAADLIARAVREAVAVRGRAVLGLATGGTPIPVYERLVEMHRAGALSFADVTTYNLDEFHPISPLDPNSYRGYMHRRLFGLVDLAPDRAHVLDGTVPAAFADEHAAQFERWISADGGLDLQLLGIGRNGHIGFNEPSELPLDEASRLPARLATLDPITIADAARDFGGEDRVIPRALTLGVATILAARAILVLAVGTNKTEAVARALRGPTTPRLPASLLQTVAGKVVWMIDEAAAGGLVSP